ncbi:NAD(P)/FAD-dependent oxidoreductase [Tepidimonas charontis]|uniref:HpnE: squalene-associated FAD-dependent desaturase n=1 Tax=Tepidimonas charontis TaxID=2267262 RepID=A0A554XHV8_9BURK|nr:FAD-dependent oxidoreductase [Tepidimonas charontis]TSE35425.1 HpnE: squalene-associated FAD-dependent desaturase [Tepidimonas charontis]
MKIAIVGSGIAGLGVAHRLRGHAHLTLFEANDYFGGHTHTVGVTLPGAHGQSITHGVDTGFLVFNERTYPNLIALLAELGVPTAPSDMSFSVQIPADGDRAGLEWGGASLASVFAQRRNLVRPHFWVMLADLLRFNRRCTQLARDGRADELQQPLGAFLDAHGFGAAFRDWYLLPMIGCIWSCPTDQMLGFPVATIIRFCHNHGLLQINGRPQWFTVAGGARQYVERIVARIDEARLRTPVRRIERDAAGVTLFTDAGAERFDEVVLATHSDQALALLARPTPQEQAVLGAIRYQANRAVLHTDTSVLPRRRSVWSAWNYERASDQRQEAAHVCLHYWLNVLQPLPFAQPVVESLNPLRPIAAERILATFEYHHPVFDATAIAAQQHIDALQGQAHTWFCGAWTGYGFHEDGLKSGYAVADALLARQGLQRAAA